MDIDRDIEKIDRGRLNPNFFNPLRVDVGSVATNRTEPNRIRVNRVVDLEPTQGLAASSTSCRNELLKYLEQGSICRWKVFSG